MPLSDETYKGLLKFIFKTISELVKFWIV